MGLLLGRRSARRLGDHSEAVSPRLAVSVCGAAGLRINRPWSGKCEWLWESVSLTPRAAWGPCLVVACNCAWLRSQEGGLGGGGTDPLPDSLYLFPAVGEWRRRNVPQAAQLVALGNWRRHPPRVRGRELVVLFCFTVGQFTL